MGIFDNIKAGGDIKISGVNINNGTGILEKIENIMKKQIKSEMGNIITEYDMKLNWGGLYYNIRLDNEKGEVFKTKEDMAVWLNKKGWRINTLHKS